MTLMHMVGVCRDHPYECVVNVLRQALGAGIPLTRVQ